MNTSLLYGKEQLPLSLNSNNVTVINQPIQKYLPDEEIGFIHSVRNPTNSPPLKEVINAKDKVAIIIPDITRPMPTSKILKWIFAELSHIQKNNFVIISGTGSHRENTLDELKQMVGVEIFKNYKVINHNAFDKSKLTNVGKFPSGRPIFMNDEAVKADKRIAIGFIEPHFVAGFSGGYKAIFPGITDIDSILHYHNAERIGNKNSTWGKIESNPTQDYVRNYGSLLPINFLINITQNANKQITQFFCGHPIEAHNRGCEFTKNHCMVGVEKEFPIVITCNNGYPLDQNLYQSVKGMSAAAKIVKKNGLIIQASKCNDGFPEHGNFKKLMVEAKSPSSLLNKINCPGFSMYDQWEAQLLAMILTHARVYLKSDLPDSDVEAAHLTPIENISSAVDGELNLIGNDSPIAVLPEGFMVIPYIKEKIALPIV